MLQDANGRPFVCCGFFLCVGEGKDERCKDIRSEGMGFVFFDPLSH